MQTRVPTPNTKAALSLYRRNLPPSEWQALSAWASSFYPFQGEWLFDPTDLAVANKSRQIGTSHTTSAIGVLWGAYHGELTTVISIGDRESVEVLDKARKHAQVLQALGSRMARFGRKDNDNELTFESGGRILALPSSGGRSFTGNVFLDEFAYQPHAAKVWDAAAPITLLGFKMRVVSTPNGIGNEFHNTWDVAKLPRSGWSTHEITIDQAIAQGYPVDLKKCWQLAKGDIRVFDQMFRCSFLDNELQYIPTDVINLCAKSDAEIVDAITFVFTSGGECYAGLDIGREVDRSVLLVLLVLRGIRYVIHVEAMKRTDGAGLEAMVARAFERYKLRRLCIDSTGLGTFPAERIKKKHSERIDVAHRRPRVELVDFTLDSKEVLATGLYSALASKAVRLPVTDAPLPKALPGTAAQLRKDLAAIRRIVTSAGNVRYDAPRTAQGHADHAWALALALHACSTPNPMVEALRARSGQGLIQTAPATPAPPTGTP